MTYLVFDLETQTAAFHGRKASPFNPENYVVARGWKKAGDTVNSWEYYKTFNRTSYLRIPEDVILLVGFNIKFDLLWERAQGNPDLQAFFKRGGKVWDCQYAEYLIMAQQEAAQMCSMDSVIEKYGGRLKIDEVKLMWSAGVETSAIPEDLLIDYLVGTEAENRNSGDIGNTELIFLGQVAAASARGQLKMMGDRMDGLLATTEMEFNGLKVDVQEAANRLDVMNAELVDIDKELQTYLPADLPYTMNWGSWQQKSAFIFGGAVKYQARAGYNDADGKPARLKAYAQWPLVNGIPIDPDVYENADNRDKQDTFLSGKRKGELKFAKVEVRGELKTKIQDFLYVFERKTAPEKEWKTEQQDPNGNPYYSTGSDVIEELSLRSVPFLKALARKQKLSKEVGTYYFTMHPKKGASGMLTMVQAHDRMLHHNLNHTLTVTTRLSSSSPNLQNIPRAPSQAKRMFVSRFTEAYCKEHGLPYYGPDTGVCIEADYSQLEVVVQGVLSGDKALCADLVAKIDFHCKRVSAKFKITYEEALDWCKNEQHPDYKAGKAARTGCKEFSFQRAYGAGAKAIAYQTGMAVEDIEQMIEAEERMYPGVIKFNELVEAKVKKSARPFQSQVNGVWRTFRRGFWQAPTGTIYSFSTKDAPEWLKKRGIADSFMPTELKNYPVQGTGGEIVQAMLGRLWRWLVSKDFFGGKAFLTNTVHDCVWLDCHADVVDEVAQAIKDILESVTEYFNERYGMKITVPFPVEVEVGPNMLDLKHWHPVDPP